MKINIVKVGKRVKGYVWKNSRGCWYSFCHPNSEYCISFQCDSIGQGIARVEMHTNEGNV
jgi:hypothetical protein